MNPPTMNGARVLVGLGTIGALAAASLSVGVVSVGAATSAPPDGDRAALRADADGALTLRPGFIGVPASSSVDDPAVTPATSVVAAARAHLDRYGAVLGVSHRPAGPAGARPGRWPARTSFGSPAGRRSPGDRRRGRRRTAPDRELGSALATVSTKARVAPTLVAEKDAAATAHALTARSSGVPAARLTVRSGAAGSSTRGRWVPLPGSGRTRSGASTSPTGQGAPARARRRPDRRVVMHLDAIESIDRVVCDSANVAVSNRVDLHLRLRPGRGWPGQWRGRRERRLRLRRCRVGLLRLGRRDRPDPAAGRRRGEPRSWRRRCASATPAEPAPTRTRSGTASRCTTGPATPARTTWSATR